MARRIKFFSDMDHAFYKTNALIADILDVMVIAGFSRDRVMANVTQLNDDGFSFDKLLESLGANDDWHRSRTLPRLAKLLETGEHYLLPGTREAFAAISKHADCALLTAGYPPFQMEKFRYLRSLHPYFIDCNFVWRVSSKGQVIGGQPEDELIIFLDDNPRQLLDVKQHAPHAHLVRMMHPECEARAHVEDNVSWTVVHSMQELTQFVLMHM